MIARVVLTEENSIFNILTYLDNTGQEQNQQPEQITCFPYSNQDTKDQERAFNKAIDFGILKKQRLGTILEIRL